MTAITDLLSEDTVFRILKTDSKNETLDALIQSLNLNQAEKQAVKKAIFERETIISTGVGRGIAMPHCKIAALDRDYGAFAILDGPIPFESVDEKPVKYIFLLASPKNDKRRHLKLLSKISRILNNQDFRSKLAQLKSSEAILKAFHQEETKYYS